MRQRFGDTDAKPRSDCSVEHIGESGGIFACTAWRVAQGAPRATQAKTEAETASSPPTKGKSPEKEHGHFTLRVRVPFYP